MSIFKIKTYSAKDKTWRTTEIIPVTNSILQESKQNTKPGNSFSISKALFEIKPKKYLNKIECEVKNSISDSVNIADQLFKKNEKILEFMDKVNFHN